MPEDEGKEQQQQKKAEPTPGIFGGMKGWIVVILVVVLEAVGFLVWIEVKDRMNLKDKAPDESIPKISLKDFNAHQIKLENLNYSIKTQGGTTATLSMDINIVLGKHPEEIQRDIRISETDWAKFEDAVRKMTPNILDRMNRHIDQQTYNQLSSPSGKEKIQGFVKEYVNSELERLDLGALSNPDISKKRVTDVLIPRFYLQ